MTNAYAVFADQGKYHTPYAIIDIKDKYGSDVTENPQGGLAAFFNMFNILLSSSFSISPPNNKISPPLAPIFSANSTILSSAHFFEGHVGEEPI